jgi:hypothetical protein
VAVPSWLTYLVVYVFIMLGFFAVATVLGLLTYLVVYVFIVPGFGGIIILSGAAQVVTVLCWLTYHVV